MKNLSVFLGTLALLGAAPSGCKNTSEGGSPVAKSNMYGIVEEAPAKEAGKPAPGGSGVGAAQAQALEQVRASMFTEERCYAHRAEYCVRDRDFVDPIIQKLLDKYYDGVMPTEKDKVDEVIQAAGSDYRVALETPDGLRRIEKLVEARFAAPVVKDEGTRVTVDFGCLPGKLSVGVGPRARMGSSESPHFAEGQWHSTEAAQALAKYAAQFPKAQIVELVVQVPDMGLTRWTYHLDRQKDAVYVWNNGMPTGAYVTEAPLGGTLDAYTGGQKSLHTGKLRWERNAQLRR